MNSIKKVLKFIFLKKYNKYLYNLYISGYLHDTGYIRSCTENNVVFKNGSPSPWYTLPFVEFIKQRIKENFNVFEYGIGNSTLFYQLRCNLVTGVESNFEWYQNISRHLVNLDNVVLVQNKAEYIRSIDQYSRRFHIICIDGLYRNDCIKEAVHYLKSDGIIILDNSDREDYLPGIEFLRMHSFKEIPFYGLQALGYQRCCTSIFYREHNCLGI